MKKPSYEKVDFLFVYEIKSREFDHICLLAAALKKQGFSVAFLNSWFCLISEYPAYDAKVVVISAGYNNGVISFFAQHAQRYEKIVNLQWEQLRAYGYYEEGVVHNWDYTGAALHTKHICWGQYSRDKLINHYNVDDDCAEVLGYLPLDFFTEQLRPLLMERQPLFEEFGLNPQKKTALFVSTLQVFSKKTEQAIDTSGSYRKRLVQFRKENRARLLELFSHAAQQHPEIQFIYRPHPSEIADESLMQAQRNNSNFFIITKYAIKHWLKNCDLIYNWQSTAMVEMYLSGTPTYLLWPLGMPHEFTNPVFDGATALTDEAALSRSLQETEHTPFPIDVDYLFSFYDIQDQPAYIRIRDYLVKVLKDDDYSGPFFERPAPSPLVASNLCVLRKELRNILVQNIQARFWNSKLNKALIRLAKTHSFSGSFWQRRRQNEIVAAPSFRYFLQIYRNKKNARKIQLSIERSKGQLDQKRVEQLALLTNCSHYDTAHLVEQVLRHYSSKKEQQNTIRSMESYL